jgi:hypothetical protein
MAPSRMKTLGALAVAFAAAVIVYFTGVSRPTTRSPRPATQPAEIAREDTRADVRDQSVSRPQRTAEPISHPQSTPPNDQRIAAVKNMVSVVLETESQAMADELTQEGVAQPDSEAAVHRFIEGFTNCIFDAARGEYEVQGMSVNEFLDAAETGSWFRTWEYLSSKRVRRAAVSCVGNVSQQNGMPMMPNFEYGGLDVDRIEPSPPVPPWASGMDSRIRDHVASYPDAGVTSVEVQCEEAGCSVALFGRAIRVFDLEFDMFAEQNGFAHAIAGNRVGNARIVWLQHSP